MRSHPGHTSSRHASAKAAGFRSSLQGRILWILALALIIFFLAKALRGQLQEPENPKRVTVEALPPQPSLTMPPHFRPIKPQGNQATTNARVGGVQAPQSGASLPFPPPPRTEVSDGSEVRQSFCSDLSLQKAREQCEVWIAGHANKSDKRCAEVSSEHGCLFRVVGLSGMR